MPKFPLKLQKSANFHIRPLIFQNFRRLRRRKFGVLGPSRPDFFGVGVPPFWSRSPQTTFGFNPVLGSFFEPPQRARWRQVVLEDTPFLVKLLIFIVEATSLYKWNKYAKWIYDQFQIDQNRLGWLWYYWLYL